MADPTVISSTLLCSAKGQGAGQLQWWQFTFDLGGNETSINVNKFKDAGPGAGTLVSLVDAGGADAAKGVLALQGSTTGLVYAADSTTEIKFVNTQNGANGAATQSIDDGEVVIVFAV